MINLLPPIGKKRLLREENGRLILILGVLFLIFLVSLTMVLFAIKIHIFSQLETQKGFFANKEKEFQETDLYAFRTKVQEVNETLITLESFYQQQSDSHDLSQKIYQLLPEGIYLDSFFCQVFDDPEKKFSTKVSLFGVALEQKDLLKFKENLENEETFEDILLPLSSWMKFKDIEFSINLKILR